MVHWYNGKSYFHDLCFIMGTFIYLLNKYFFIQLQYYDLITMLFKGNTDMTKK